MNVIQKSRTATPNPVKVVIEPRVTDRDPDKYERRLKRQNTILAVATPIVLILLWELAARGGIIDVRFFPPPSSIAVTGWELVENGMLPTALLVTIRTLLIGLVVGNVVGTVVGMAMGLVRPLRAAFDPLLSGLYTVPKLAVLPLFMLLLGLGEPPRIVVVAIGSFFIAWITMLEATMGVAHGYLETAESLELTRGQRLRRVLVPAVLPEYFVGLRIAVGNAVLLIVGVEFVMSSEGIGSLIWRSWQIFATERMYAGIVCVGLLGYVLTKLVTIAARVAVPWGPKSMKRRR
ncbi:MULTISPECIES: ABC transporter permease [Thermocrispum]|uniref:ABC transporter permease n=3 Tax=Thermocrispum agreste TaxID=37925 RepID=A0ABD6FFG8_9PSEU|nr:MULTISPECIES: ABC transporter permease [Thermocrispum]